MEAPKRQRNEAQECNAVMRIALDSYMHRHLPLQEPRPLAARLGYEWIELGPRGDLQPYIDRYWSTR